MHSSGRAAEAIEEYERCLGSDDDPWVRALLALSLAAAGRRVEGSRQRDLLLAEATKRYVPNVALAIAQAALDERDEAFSWLEKDLSERSLYPPFYEFDPVFDELRADPRFGGLVERVRLAKFASGAG